MAILIAGWLGLAGSVSAENGAPATVLNPTGNLLSSDHPALGAPPDQACRVCHAQNAGTITFASGETLSVQVDLAALAASPHGLAAETPLVCTACHQPAANYSFPHPAVALPDARSYSLARATACQRCHQDAHLTSHPGPESANPITCTDCHGAHEQLSVAQWEAGEGSAVCVACHTQVGKGPLDPDEVTTLINNGLFVPRADNAYCLACHSRPDKQFIFPNGDVLSLTISAEDLHNSVHGANNPWQPLQCTNCHTNLSAYPHPPLAAESHRAFSLERYPLCGDCHEQNYDKTLDSVHGKAIAEGKAEAAVCTDCHGAHNTPTPNEPRSRISHTCQKCHSQIFDEYATSVHGEALLTESNPDVPTCIECHGVHNINDPTTNLFRIRSPLLCANCHANVELMTQYDISTNVFNSYVADFHGTTITLFEQQNLDSESNKAVCYDCHGVHSIKRPDDPQSGIKANLLITCQQCHPNATANFPDAWASHFEPSLQHNPLVYLVNLFYKIVIPATLAFFGFFVATDIYRRIRKRIRR